MMKTFNSDEKRIKIKLAGHVIEIYHIYDFLRSYCEGYLIGDDETADVVIRSTMSDINFEREKSAREDEKEGIPVRTFPEDYLETLSVYRKIAEELLNYNIILFHGSVIAADGKAFLFTAKSGTGKSTHTRLWRELLGEKAVMVNDDKPLLAITEDGVIAYGTPWNGKHRLGNNIAVPLGAICILERNSKNEIIEITSKAAYAMVMQQIYKPVGSQPMVKTLGLVDELLTKVRFYRLGCNMDIEAARVAYEGMR